MKNIINYLDELKEKEGSDNAAAKALGIERTTIANIRRRGQMSDETAIKIADMLKIDRLEVLLAATIARSEGDVKSSWLEASKRAGIAAGLALVAVMSGSFSDQAKEGASKLKEFDNLYIMRIYGWATINHC